MTRWPPPGRLILRLDRANHLSVPVGLTLTPQPACRGWGASHFDGVRLHDRLVASVPWAQQCFTARGRCRRQVRYVQARPHAPGCRTGAVQRQRRRSAAMTARAMRSAQWRRHHRSSRVAAAGVSRGSTLGRGVVSGPPSRVGWESQERGGGPAVKGTVAPPVRGGRPVAVVCRVGAQRGACHSFPRAVPCRVPDYP